MPNPLYVLIFLAIWGLLFNMGIHFDQGRFLMGAADALGFSVVWFLTRALRAAGRFPATLIIPRTSSPEVEP